MRISLITRQLEMDIPKELPSCDASGNFISTFTSKKKVVVHVTLMNIGKINALNNCFDADVLLRSTWQLPELDKNKDNAPMEDKRKNPFLCWNPDIHIENSFDSNRVSSSVALEYDSLGSAYAVEQKQISGTFFSNMSLEHFPLDIQELSVKVTTKKTKDEVELEENSGGMHKIRAEPFYHRGEWKLCTSVRSTINTEFVDVVDPNRQTSALTVTCFVARRAELYLWRSFLVTVLIGFFAPFTDTGSRDENKFLAILLSLLLIGILIVHRHLINMNNTMFKPPHMTSLDWYWVFTLLYLTVVLIWHFLANAIHLYDERIVGGIVCALIHFGFTTYYVFVAFLEPWKRQKLVLKHDDNVLAI